MYPAGGFPKLGLAKTGFISIIMVIKSELNRVELLLQKIEVLLIQSHDLVLFEWSTSWHWEVNVVDFLDYFGSAA